MGKPVPAIDGNVKRVISRIFGVLHDIKSRKGMEEIDLCCQCTY